MPIAARQWTLERAVQAAVVATIVLAVIASGSIQSWIPLASRLRWVALIALAAVAVAWAWRRRAARVRAAAIAAAAGFVALAAVSAAWSVEPISTVGRAGALALVLGAAAALAWAAAGRPDAAQRVVDGVVAGAAVVALGGLLVLLFRYDRAVAAATPVLPARYQGLGGGPNTATMLMAVALPAAAHVALDRGRALRRMLGWAVALGLLASIVASGSRGALVGACVGTAAFAALRAGSPRRAVAAGAVVLAIFAAAFGVSRIPDPAGAGAPAPEIAADPNPPPISAAPGYVWVDTVLRLQDDVGRPPPGVGAGADPGRQLAGSSGRGEAWRGAAEQALDRPLAGYGFGTEDDVFVDRYVGFNSGVPENSYVGLALQLGLVGLAAFGALVAALLVPAVRALGRLDDRRRRLVAACAGVFLGGLVLALFQSYVYAAGNNATAALWICAFLLVALRADAAER